MLTARHLDADIRGRALPRPESVMPGLVPEPVLFAPGPSGDIQPCLHPRSKFVDRGTGTVAVKFSSWPTAQNHAYLLDMIRAFSRRRLLAELARSRPPTRSGRPTFRHGPDANEAVADGGSVPANPRTRGTASRA